MFLNRNIKLKSSIFCDSWKILLIKDLIHDRDFYKNSCFTVDEIGFMLNFICTI